MDFDPNQVTVPEAMDRANQLNSEIEGRSEQINELEHGVRQRQGEIETHKMHIASCQAALEPLRAVLDTQPKTSMAMPPMPDSEGQAPPIRRRY